MVLFLVGILEMILITAWTKVVTSTQVVISGAITMINIFIWYYVLQVIVDDINNWFVVFMYALGCAVGTMITTLFFSLKEKGKLSLLGLERINNYVRRHTSA